MKRLAFVLFCCGVFLTGCSKKEPDGKQPEESVQESASEDMDRPSLDVPAKIDSDHESDGSEEEESAEIESGGTSESESNTEVDRDDQEADEEAPGHEGEAEEGLAVSGEEAVRNTFEAYRSALKEQEGDKAIKHLTDSSIDYYKQIKQHALSTSKEDLRKQPLIDQLMVLQLRQQMDAEALSDLAPADLIGHVSKRGLISRNKILQASVGNITITGDTAVAEDQSSGKGPSVTYAFEKTEEGWKLNLTTTLREANELFKKLAHQQNMEEETFLFSFLQTLTGENPSETLWEPLKND